MSNNKTKGLKESHSSNSKYGMGDHYGQGIKNPIGKPREVMGLKPMGPKKIGKPPKKLA